MLLALLILAGCDSEDDYEYMMLPIIGLNGNTSFLWYPVKKKKKKKYKKKNKRKQDYEQI